MTVWLHSSLGGSPLGPPQMWRRRYSVGRPIGVIVSHTGPRLTLTLLRASDQLRSVGTSSIHSQEMVAPARATVDPSPDRNSIRLGLPVASCTSMRRRPLVRYPLPAS